MWSTSRVLRTPFFFECPRVKQVLKIISNSIQLTGPLAANVDSCWWMSRSPMRPTFSPYTRNLAFATVLWYVWWARNDCCFRHALLIVSQVLYSTHNFYSFRAGAAAFTRGRL